MSDFRSVMPAIVRHEGVWDGIYRVVARDGSLVDQHEMRTTCEFPETGLFAYIQHNHLRWSDGRELNRSFGGVWRDGMLWWDTDRLSGYGWETRDGVVMLNLKRKDKPGVHFIEMMTISSDGAKRAWTWQWFRNGTPFQRTLCDEWRAD